MKSHRFLAKRPATAALVVASASCSLPSFVENRPDLEDCGSNDVYLPLEQGPREARASSVTAIECFMQGRSDGRSVELGFVLVGAEGEHYDAWLQTLADGRVNYFHESDEGWVGFEGCSELAWPEPGVPDVAGCERIHPVP